MPFLGVTHRRERNDIIESIHTPNFATKNDNILGSVPYKFHSKPHNSRRHRRMKLDDDKENFSSCVNLDLKNQPYIYKKYKELQQFDDSVNQNWQNKDSKRFPLQNLSNRIEKGTDHISFKNNKNNISDPKMPLNEKPNIKTTTVTKPPLPDNENDTKPQSIIHPKPNPYK